MTERFATRAIHAGQEFDPTTGAVTPPIHQTSTFVQDGIGGLRGGYEYSRGGNPTRTSLETQLAALENGAHGLSFDAQGSRFVLAGQSRGAGVCFLLGFQSGLKSADRVFQSGHAGLRLFSRFCRLCLLGIERSPLKFCGLVQLIHTRVIVLSAGLGASAALVVPGGDRAPGQVLGDRWRYHHDW